MRLSKSLDTEDNIVACIVDDAEGLENVVLLRSGNRLGDQIAQRRAFAIAGVLQIPHRAIAAFRSANSRHS